MKISFENAIHDVLDIQIEDGGCKIITTNPYRRDGIDYTTIAEYFLSKKQLSDVIGQLLHVQSKLKNARHGG